MALAFLKDIQLGRYWSCPESMMFFVSMVWYIGSAALRLAGCVMSTPSMAM